jgi:crotonobetainyl-CoA:carnitine CoA-transferase CaiB-like acyl-CoA transferase
MIADVVAAVYAFGAVQTALLRREREGVGAAIDATLLEAMLSLVAIQIQEAQAPVPAAPKIFRPTRTRDGFVIVPLVSPRNYLALYPRSGAPSGAATRRSRRGAGSPQTKPRSSARWANGRLPATRAKWSRRSPRPASPARATARPPRCSTTRILRERGSFAPLSDTRGHFAVLNPPFRFADLDCSGATARRQARRAHTRGARERARDRRRRLRGARAGGGVRKRVTAPAKSLISLRERGVSALFGCEA